MSSVQKVEMSSVNSEDSSPKAFTNSGIAKLIYSKFFLSSSSKDSSELTELSSESGFKLLFLITTGSYPSFRNTLLLGAAIQFYIRK